MREKIVPSAWLEKEGRRLDCGPYLSGALEARLLLEQVGATKEPLQRLTQGGMDGIFHAGRHSRTFVSSAEHGIPFLSSSDVLLAEFSRVDLISRRQTQQIPQFILGRAWTLITRSGTIGRMAYSRPDMNGLACSEHVLRVVPDAALVKPGFLFAFLSSRFGVPMVIGGTYGSIIQSIEPQHIANLPVPIAPARIQEAAHKLVEEAGELRTKASTELRAVISEIEHAAGLPVLDNRYDGLSPDVSIVKAHTLGGRMDGLFHSKYHRSALEPLLALPRARRTTVGELSTRVLWPPMFKRIQVGTPQHGVPFFGTTAMMWADPKPSYLLSKRTKGIDDLIVEKTTILVPASGQLNGIIGHAVLPFGELIGAAVTHHAIRVFTRDEDTAGYLFACLASEYCRRQLKSRAFGSSVPALDETRVGTTVIPLLEPGHRATLGRRAFDVAQARHEAVAKDLAARALVENWIDQKGGA